MKSSRLSGVLAVWRSGLCALGVLCLVWAAPAHAADGPTVVKSRVYIGVEQSWHYWSPQAKKFIDNTTSWMPQMRFRVVGPVPGGSQFSVEFTKPGGRPWLELDCPTQEIGEGRWVQVETPRDTSTAGEKKYTTGLGVFGFKIRMKNELAGQNAVLFSGRFKVGKIPKGNGFKGRENIVDYYVDHDWVLPFGYIRSRAEADNLAPHFSVVMWFKGDTNGSDLAGYLFYKGKQIGSTKEFGSASTTEESLNTASNDKNDPTWQLWQMEWYTLLWDNPEPDKPINGLLYLDKNPGDYEIKVLRKGKLARQAKFTVGEDGKIMDNGLVAANKLGTSRLVLPVKVLGTLDGAWQKTAWKTDAFYGNPLKGFTAP